MTAGERQQLREWAPTTHDALTPVGQVEQAGRFAYGLRTNARGRRRAARMLLALVVVVVVAVAVVVGSVLGLS